MKNKKIKEIYFVTSNKNKVRDFQSKIGSEFKIKHINISYPELRSDDSEEIARMSAKQLSDKLKKAIVVEDSGIFIKALNGFPGTCSAYVHKRIGLKGILTLMKGIKDRSCEYRSAIAYCEPGKKAISFLGTEKGRIALKEKGKFGWGHDPIFIPEGKNKTYGELKIKPMASLFRQRSIEKLVMFLKTKKQRKN